jgi:glucose/arabinose dehydrogenase
MSSIHPGQRSVIRLTGHLAAPWRRRALRLAGVLCAAAAGALLVLSCGGGGGSAGSGTPPGSVDDPVLGLRATVLPVALAEPWGMAFLPDGRMLVTQRAGTFAIVKADGSAIDATLPHPLVSFTSNGQAGLLDVALDPEFATNQRIFWTFSETGTGGAGTAVARARLTLGDEPALSEVVVIYRQVPKLNSSVHYGSRLAFRSDRTLYVTLGERGQDDPANPTSNHAQSLAKTLGKVVRIDRDGNPAAGNPDLGGTALPEIWSFGHRNPQGAAIQPGTDDLWLVEHGPQGGDELNRVQAGLNYGWPLRSYGCPYGSPVGEACRVSGGAPHAPDFEEPKTFWVPTSTAPSGMLFYTGDKFDDLGWRNSVFVGGLAGETLWRVVLDPATHAAVSREEIGVIQALQPRQRIRNVAQGPDGLIYLLSTEGSLIRIER